MLKSLSMFRKLTLLVLVLGLTVVGSALAQDTPKGRLTTHVLDTANGKPGAGMKLMLYSVDGDQRELIKETTTNSDGRTDEKLLEGAAVKVGQYEIVFFVGDYFADLGVELPSPRFLDKVTIAFGIFDAEQNYHVPLLVSPWTYTTYRGS